MSYCRWSSTCEDGFDSDLYIYDHIGGFISVNVAASRYVDSNKAPPVPAVVNAFDEEEFRVWYKARAARNEWFRNQPLQSIDLPHAGETFEFESAEDCVTFLRELRALGYHMPDSVLNADMYDR